MLKLCDCVCAIALHVDKTSIYILSYFRSCFILTCLLAGETKAGPTSVTEIMCECDNWHRAAHPPSHARFHALTKLDPTATSESTTDENSKLNIFPFTNCYSTATLESTTDESSKLNIPSFLSSIPFSTQADPLPVYTTALLPPPSSLPYYTYLHGPYNSPDKLKHLIAQSHEID